MAAAHPFVLFGREHLTVLTLIAGASVALVAGRRWVTEPHDRWLRRVAAIALLGNEVIALVVAVLQGRARVPLQLCDVALFITVWALWRPRRRVSELAYFWGVTGSVQALLTPDVRRSFPDYWWITFFITHGGVVCSAVYFAVTGRVRPTIRSVWYVFGVSNVYVLVAGVLNAIYGTNYGYLAHKPSQPSLLDYFGPWPYYIGVLEVAALGLFFLAYLPFARPATRTTVA